MKKILCLITIVILVLLCTACAMEAAPPNPNYKPEVRTPEPVQETLNEAPVKTEVSVKPDILYAGMIPDPKTVFANGKITVTDSDGGTAYHFQVKNYTEDEYKTYISQCKELGFNKVSFETDEDFGAYSKDSKYWVQLSIDNKKDILYVICQASKNK